MKNIKRYIRQYFDFSQRETNGFLLLSFLILILILAPFLFQKFYPNRAESDIIDAQKLDSLLASIEIDSSAEKSTSNFEKSEQKSIEISLFQFNPNLISAAEFQKLGVKKYIAERIIKYRQKGGVFKTKTDLKRIYGFDSVLFTKLDPYILLPEKTSFTKIETQKEIKSVPKTIVFDINLADSAQLEKVYGIGAKLVARILKYRNKLGGFVSKNQLKEVYGLDSVVLDELNKKTTIAADFIPQKIKINQTTFEELKSHPYFGYKNAKVILAYKSTNGKIIDKEDLKNIKILSKEEIEKMVFYLDFE